MLKRVLIVDDEQAMLDVVAEGLASAGGFVVRCETSARLALSALGAEEFDCVVTDLKMTGMSGIELCEKIASNRPDLPVIVITAFGSMDTAVAALRAGAYDFITKPLEVDMLILALERAIKHKNLQEEVKKLRSLVEATQKCEDIVGASQPMRKVFELIDRIADTATSVLITGETGTGKELTARAIHKRSQRGSARFVAVDCAAMPEALLESELFGHVKGAFTDARASRTGLLVLADGGTLFMDEIGNLPLGLQPKLLRALQERVVRPVGGSEEIPFDARIIAATNRDLEADVEKGVFRQDLFYRLNVVNIDMPPLRARGNDVLLLAQHFIELFARRSGRSVRSLSTAAAEKLLNYPWPGNIRELQNCVERAVALTQYEQLSADDLPEKIQKFRRTQFVIADESASDFVSLDEMERRYILRVLESVGGNKSTAARILGLDRRTLYRKLETYLAS